MENWKDKVQAVLGSCKLTLAATTKEATAYNADFYAKHCQDCKVNPETGENTCEDYLAVNDDLPDKCWCCEKYCRNGYHTPYAPDDSDKDDPCINERPTQMEVGEGAANDQVDEVCQLITEIINDHSEILKQRMQKGNAPFPGKWTRIHIDSQITKPLIKEVLDFFVKECHFEEGSVFLKVMHHAGPEVLSVEYGW